MGMFMEMVLNRLAITKNKIANRGILPVIMLEGIRNEIQEARTKNPAEIS